MYRCITDLKGIAVDLDSLNDDEVASLTELNNLIPCVILTTDEAKKALFVDNFGENKVIFMEKFERLFSPNKMTHIKVLKALNIRNTELAYLSRSHNFIVNANGFLSGTIWITDSITYEEVSNSPDLIAKNMVDVISAIKNNMVGYYGEMIISPLCNGSGTMIPVEFKVDEIEVPMYTLGRYFGYSHYMNQLHPYSTAIYLNKKPNKSYTGVFDEQFTTVFSKGIAALKTEHQIECVCSVPVKPGKRQRFAKILDQVANNCGIENIDSDFTCVRDYPDQKALSKEERESNIVNVFECNRVLNGKSIALIDDISSTGATLRECVRELKRKGADSVVVVVLAVNQIGAGSYWSADSPQVTCKVCGSKMTLFASKYGKFFYSCMNCYSLHGQSSTLDFSKGWETVCFEENTKFDLLTKPEKEDAETVDCIESDSLFVRQISCPHCKNKVIVNLLDFGDISYQNRPMGMEQLIQFDTDELDCDICGDMIHIDGYISIYPEGAFNAEEINIDKSNKM